MNCAVKNCGSKSQKEGLKLTFHRFPADKERRMLWQKQLDLLETVLTSHTAVCSLHFTPENFIRKYVRPRWKVFLKPDAVPINWFEDPRNIPDYRLKHVTWIDDPRNVPKNEPEKDIILDETEIKVEPEQISYTNTSEIFFLPKIESSTSTIKFVEAQHVADKVKLENENGVVVNESMEKDNAVKQFVVAENEIMPGTSEILWELRSRNEKNKKLQKKIQALRKKVRCLQQQVRRRDKTIQILKANAQKNKSKENAEAYPTSPQSVEFSSEELEEIQESEDSDLSLDQDPLT